MLSLDTAKKLKQAGLQWTPALHDFFFVPYQDLDERVFVISDMSVIIEAMGEENAITFNGTAEWALDYLVVSEAVWVPTETQLRAMLEKKLVQLGGRQPVVTLMTNHDGYVCEIRYRGETLRFDDFGACEAYGLALVYVLGHEH